MFGKRFACAGFVCLVVVFGLAGGCPPPTSNIPDNDPTDGNTDNTSGESLTAPSRLGPFDKVAAGDVRLSWNIVGGAENYVVYAGTEEDPPRVLGITETTYVIETAECTTYYWRVEARAGQQVSSSPVWSFRTICPTDRPSEPAYPAPSDGAYDVAGKSTAEKVTLQWSATQDTERYDVYLGLTASPAYVGTSGTASFTTADLAKGRRYYWRVVSRNNAGETSSDLWSFWVREQLAGPEAAVMRFPPENAKELPSKLRLDWSDSSGIEQYELYLGTEADPPLKATLLKSEYTTPNNLQLGERYYWRVASVNGGGSNSTPVSSFIVAAEPQPPLMPGDPEPLDGQSDVGTASVLSWTPIANADEYDVYVGPSGSVTLAATVTDAAYVPGNAWGSNTSFSWHVVARNGIGETVGPEWQFITGQQTIGIDDDAEGGDGEGGGTVTALGFAGCDSALWRVNRTITGGQTALGARWPVMSSDARYVAYGSPSDDIVPGDTNGIRDVFVYDRVTSESTRISVSSTGAQGTQHVMKFSMSGDGRYVTFDTPSNLASGDSYPGMDVYVHDRETHQTRCLSAGGNKASDDSCISADGRIVVFTSAAGNLVSGDTNGNRDVFAYDMQTDVLERVSVASDGSQLGMGGSWPSVSNDGRYVVFSSQAIGLGGNPAGSTDVYVRDRVAGTTTWAGAANLVGLWPAISGDGQRVAFTAFPPGTLDFQLYMRAWQTSSATLVSGGIGGVGNAVSWQPAFSSDGRYLAFTSIASNLLAGANGRTAHIYRFDAWSDELIRLDYGVGGEEANDHAISACISADGQTVAFDSKASNLVSGDTNGRRDVFLICVP